MRATIYPIKADPYRLAIVSRPRGGDWLRDELMALSHEGVEALVSMLTEDEAEELGLSKESEECAAAGITFVNIPIPDRSVPSDRNEFLRGVDRLAQMVRDGRFLGVHCRACIGRSSLLAVAVLVRLGRKVEEAFDAVEVARGCSVPDTLEQRRWVVANVPGGSVGETPSR